MDLFKTYDKALAAAEVCEQHSCDRSAKDRFRLTYCAEDDAMVVQSIPWCGRSERFESVDVHEVQLVA